MARVIINSIDSFGEKISQKIIATKMIADEYTHFKYDNKQGKGEIKIFSDSVEILKFGDIQSKLHLKKDSTTDFIYNTSYFNKIFKVKCKKFDYSENKLTISYTIYDGNIEINQLEIEIIEVK